MPAELNIAAGLAARALSHPDRIAITEYRWGRPRRLTFGELGDAVAATAATLRARGVTRGDRVLLLVPMSAALYVAMLGCLHVGATAVFVDAWADRRRLDAAVRKADPRAFIGSWKAQLLRLVSPSVRRIPVHLVATAAVQAPGSAPRIACARAEADDVALITFTTGSTGAPKAALRTHAFLWAQHRALAEHLRLREEDVDMPTLPIFVLNNLALGVTSVIPAFDPRRPAEIDPARIWRQVVAEGVTTTSGSPAFYDRLLEWGGARHERLPVRALFTGGAPVLPPLARRLQEGITGRAEVIYGSTEAEPISGIGTAELLEAEARAARVAGGDSTAGGVCVGTPSPSVELRLIRACDTPVTAGPDGLAALAVEAGAIGEIVVSGAHVLRGYLDDPMAERATKIPDGARVWHRTGDAGRLDAEGRLWLMGRVRERVVRDGTTWWGLAAEVRALRDARVRHAAYLGVADGLGGARAVLVVESTASWSEADRSALVARVAPHPVDEVRVLQRIPRDPRHASKTDVEALRRLL